MLDEKQKNQKIEASYAFTPVLNAEFVEKLRIQDMFTTQRHFESNVP